MRKHLSEQLRLAELDYNACDDNASRLEEGRSILMATMKLNLVEAKVAKSMAAAEDHARASDEWKGYVRKMHDARRKANDAKAELKKLERDYFAAVADERSEQNQVRYLR